MGGAGGGGDRLRRRVDTVAIASPSTSVEVNLSAVHAMYELQGWADLPDGLLHSIVALLCTFPDLHAFASTSCSWRAAFSPYPSKQTFSTLFPPLLLQPDIPWCSPCPYPVSNSFVPRLCHVTDITNEDTYCCCQIPLFAQINTPPSPLDEFCFRGSSYGHLILSSKTSCLLVDVFTGVTVSPPQLPVNQATHIYYGALTAPLASPDSHLIVSTDNHNFFWHVGDRSWSGRSLPNGTLTQIVVLEGKVFGMDAEHNIFTGSSHVRTGQTFEAFRLDLSTEPATWVKVDILQNRAIFLGSDERSRPFCCMNPERWGGKSNCLYYYTNNRKNWTAVELGEPLKGHASNTSIFMFTSCFTMLTPMWVVPSMFSS